MIGRLSFPFLLVMFALLVALPLWLGQSPYAPSLGENGTSGRIPDYVVENFSALRMDDDGVARRTLLGKRLVHYPDDESMDLEQPRLINTEPGKPPMQVKADQAKMSANGEDIYLSGNVTVVRNAGRGRGETTMATSFLHVRPDDDIARTDQPVVITETNSVIKAVGMEMSNRTGITQLLSQVRVVNDKAR
ncbi:MAG: LPS export ABC transporter periplasmic protein LptC [Nitrosospira sp.]|nr:LPS export ABC transporter periplasmic protein LptC [Nitrosospira sp.]